MPIEGLKMKKIRTHYFLILFLGLTGCATVQTRPVSVAHPPRTWEAPPLSLPSFPLVHNQAVQKQIEFFQGAGRERFELYLSRSGRYLPMIQEIFRHHGLPRELAYQALV